MAGEQDAGGLIAFGVFIIFSYSSSSTDRSMVMPDEGVRSGWMMFPLLACSTSGQKRVNYPFSSLNPTTQQFNNCVVGFLELWKVQTGRQHGAVPLRYHPSSVSSSTVRSRMVVTEALGIGLHSSSVQRALHGGWKYDGPCPDAGLGWTRLQKHRICSRQGPRVDFEYVAPDGKRFRSLVAAQKHSSQLSQDSAVVCTACASEECTPGNDIVICEGACGLAFHQ